MRSPLRRPRSRSSFDYTDLPAEAAQKINARRVEKLEDFLSQCDVVTVNCPLHEGTKDLIVRRVSSERSDAARTRTRSST